MHKKILLRASFISGLLLFCVSIPFAQTNFKLKFKRSSVYAGIEVGSKGVKISVLEIGKNAQNTGTFNVLTDSSVNTDFISFTQSTFSATLNALTGLYQVANVQYKIAPENIYTVLSSGVKVQAEKDNKLLWVKNLSDSFRKKINEPGRKVDLVDVVDEARLSHLGIVPEAKRYSTFLIDIGSGNTKGGYFPNGNTNDFKLFQLTWGTKSIANGTEKRMEEDKSLANYQRQLYRVLEGAANQEIIYAVNVSGAYNMSDNIAFSGGIAWAVSNLLFPELLENSVVPVTYDEVLKFSQQIYSNYGAYTPAAIVNKITDKNIDKIPVAQEIKTINKVFDQRALLAGTGLLLKIMRQFEGVYEHKQFFLVKSGQVGWISAYVDQNSIKQ
jgi:hypothetical protein